MSGKASDVTSVQPASASIAIVGLECRLPDADDTTALLDAVLTGRRAFRRIPPARVDLAEYYDPDPNVLDATYGTRAALLEGWHFDRDAFGFSGSDFDGTDPAHWLALETSARTLAASGFPGGAGLPTERTGVFIGNRPAENGPAAAALRLRWPYTRAVLADALTGAGISPRTRHEVLVRATARFLAPFPDVTAQSLTGGSAAGLASAICGRFGFGGGGLTADVGDASSLAAITSACLALSAGQLDAALACGVDLGIDPYALVALAKSGRLARTDMRVYDASPTGFLPGEGCGAVLLMRTADARASDLPVYAEIVGWGTASASGASTDDRAGAPDPDSWTRLLAMRRAHEMAGIEPAEVQLVEGAGTGVGPADDAELSALAALRSGSRQVAVLGSISANIGNAGAAAGVAGLTKAVLAIRNGVLPPSTGVRTPHPMLQDGQAALRLAGTPEPWPAGTRHAGISSGSQGITHHLILRGEPGEHITGSKAPQLRPARFLVRSQSQSESQSQSQERADAEPAVRLAAPRASGNYAPGRDHTFAYLLRAPGQAGMIKLLSRIAKIAPWLSDAQMQDLAVQLASSAGDQQDGDGHEIRIALTAASQEQLADLAKTAVALVQAQPTAAMSARPGIYLAAGPSGPAPAATDKARPKVALVISGQLDELADLPLRQLSRLFAILSLLDDMGVEASVAVGHGVGELAGLVWAGCATAVSARALMTIRSAAVTAPRDLAPGELASTIGKYSTFSFRPPQRQLISGCTGCEVTAPNAIAEVLSAELFDARLAADLEAAEAVPDAITGSERALGAAILKAAKDSVLVVQTGQDRTLARVIAGLDLSAVSDGEAGSLPPVVSIDGDPADDATVARAAAALFAAGAITKPEVLYAKRPSRPFDIWHDPVFITHPCQRPVRMPQEMRAQQEKPAPQVTRSPQTAATTKPAVSQATAGGDPAAIHTKAGAKAWFRCYAEHAQPPSIPVHAGDDQPWRVYTGGCGPLDLKAREIFRHDPAASRTLVLLGQLDDPATSQAAVMAARDAIGTGQLVAIGTGSGMAGFWATLHAEHPDTGVMAIRAPLTADGIAAARSVAAPVRGEFRELVVAKDGTVTEPVMQPVTSMGGAPFPLGPEDVVLISRGSGAAGLTLAQVLACGGAAVAIVGRFHPAGDEQVIAGIEKLRGAGAKIAYELVDLFDHAALVGAVRRIEARFGCVTAIGHATGPMPAVAVTNLTPQAVHGQVRAHTAPLDQLAAAVRAVARSGGRARRSRLQLILTCGSITGRYGLPAESLGAYVSCALADYGEQTAAASPGCKSQHIDWPAWAGEAVGERADLPDAMVSAGYAVMPVGEAPRLLLKALATEGLPARIAVHGRVGVPAPRPIAVTGALGQRDTSERFIERILVHYPGVELIAEARLSLLADPYLLDYQTDGVPVLPPTMALEAMAQVASALAGVHVRLASQVAMRAPVVLAAGMPGSQTVIRIYAIKEGDAITIRVRSDNSGFAVDHCRAAFSMAASELIVPNPAVPKLAGPEAEDRLSQDTGEHPSVAGLSADDLYGNALFQTGRFRLLRHVRLAGRRSARGMAEPAGLADRQPWFGAVPPARAGTTEHDLVLGNAGLADAALQVVQACMRGRRMLVAGCESVWFSEAFCAGQIADGQVTIIASQDPASGADASAAVPGGAGEADGPAADRVVPRPRTGSGQGAGEMTGPAWDVRVSDAAGRLLIAWGGLRMRDAGPLALPVQPDAGQLAAADSD
jgi:enediyne polyketide synthase